jgi:hypothetical protein
MAELKCFDIRVIQRHVEHPEDHDSDCLEYSQSFVSVAECFVNIYEQFEDDGCGDDWQCWEAHVTRESEYGRHVDCFTIYTDGSVKFYEYGANMLARRLEDI